MFQASVIILKCTDYVYFVWTALIQFDGCLFGVLKVFFAVV